MIKKIGERISRLRKTKGFTQANMAEELGITTSSYSKIERGDTDANTSRLSQIAKILEVNISDFFEEKPVHQLAADEIKNYGFAPKEDVEHLTKLVQSIAKEMEKMREEIAKLNSAKGKKKK